MIHRYRNILVWALLFALLFSVGLFAQDKRVTLALNNVPLKQAIEGIAKQANMQLLFSDSFIPVNRIVSIDVKNVTVNEALTQVLAQTATDYRLMSDGRIILVPTETVRSQDKGAVTIKGKVTDSKTGEGIPGANVFIKSLSLGTSAKADGSYSFEVPEEKAVGGKASLMARAVGYAQVAQTVTLSGGILSVNFVLTESVINLDEVTVTGSMSELSVRESAVRVETISLKNLEYRNLTNLTSVLTELSGTGYSALADQGASNQRGYKPSYPIANIRGYAPPGIGFTGGNVKYLVDGAEIFDYNQSNFINPNDIEKIEVLSGPMATSIYGTGAAGGVISITTKQGTGKSQLGVRAMFTSMSDPLQVSDPLITDYTVYYRAGKPEFGFNLSANFTKSRNSRYKVASPQDEIFTTLTGKLNGIVDNIKVDLRVDYTKGVTGYAFQNYWYEVAKREGWPNPDKFLSTTVTDTRYYTNTLNAALNLNQPLTDKLYHKLTAGYSSRHNPMGPFTPSKIDGKDAYSMYEYLHSTKNLNYFLNYTSPLTDDFKIDLTGGYYYNEQVPEVISGNYSQPIQDYQIGNLVGTSGTHNIYVVRTNAVFVNAVWGLWNSLYLTTGYRAEKNTSVGTNQGWLAMPRVGLTYVTTFGDFTVKPRVAWGKSLQAVNPIQSQGVVSPTYQYLPAPDLKPQSNTGYEAGADLYYTNNYSLSLTYFDQKIGDLIQILELYSTPIRTMQAQNFASVLNKGLQADFKARLEPFTLNIAASTISSKYGPGNRIGSSASTAYLAEGNRAIQVPAGKLFVRVSYDLPALLSWTDKGGSISVDYRFTGNEVYRDNYNYNKIWAETGKYPVTEWITTPGYALVGMQFNYPVQNNVTVFCDVTNLLNNQSVVSGNFAILQGRKINFGFNLTI